ncbi:hypothetical protein EON65_45270 [archaeon]|nr:MAG: hypothetical protein EON65_45270 [archaeon]
MLTIPLKTQLGAGKHGDTVRSLAGARSAANQIEYINKFKTASPVLTPEVQEAVREFMEEVGRE